MTCLGADVLDMASLVAEAPHGGAYGGGKRCPIEAPHLGAP